MNWEPVIGLEIHVHLKTRTKMFCGCELSFGDDPNTHTCPVCLGHPGTLPVTNAEAGKRAAILESEGQREAQIQKAEGEKGASILRAQGLAEARLAMANAEAEALKLITASLPPGEAAMYLLGLKYLEALPSLAQGKGSTIFLPAEAAGVMGAIGGMRELLKGPAAPREATPGVPGAGPLGSLK